jgi:hypothetical protein
MEVGRPELARREQKRWSRPKAEEAKPCSAAEPKADRENVSLGAPCGHRHGTARVRVQYGLYFQPLQSDVYDKSHFMTRTRSLSLSD